MGCLLTGRRAADVGGGSPIVTGVGACCAINKRLLGAVIPGAWDFEQLARPDPTAATHTLLYTNNSQPVKYRYLPARVTRNDRQCITVIRKQGPTSIRRRYLGREIGYTV
jgi:hypothetical protein